MPMGEPHPNIKNQFTIFFTSYQNDFSIYLFLKQVNLNNFLQSKQSVRLFKLIPSFKIR